MSHLTRCSPGWMSPKGAGRSLFIPRMTQSWQTSWQPKWVLWLGNCEQRSGNRSEWKWPRRYAEPMRTRTACSSFPTPVIPFTAALLETVPGFCVSCCVRLRANRKPIAPCWYRLSIGPRSTWRWLPESARRSRCRWEARSTSNSISPYQPLVLWWQCPRDIRQT